MRFVKEAGCDAVKLERGGSSVDRARAIIRAGIPVMGHVGLTPQTATALGGFKAQGKTAGRASTIADEALALQAAGCFSIVFEAVPADVTEALMTADDDPRDRDRRRRGSTDGQVLVFHDLLGIFGGHSPKFVKRYAEVREQMVAGVSRICGRGPRARFPGPGARLRDRCRSSSRRSSATSSGTHRRRRDVRRRLVRNRDLRIPCSAA